LPDLPDLPDLKVLVTNDDGIDAPGLWAAAGAFAGAAQVFVVAPDREQSGVGSSLTLHSPIRVNRVRPAAELDGIAAYSVQGTPADSCVLALEKLVGPVDLVVSGINSGSNLGQDVLISGTVGAALQGYFRDVPSLAVSVGAVTGTRFEVAADLLRHLAGRLAAGAAIPPSLINVNLPNEPADRIQGVRVTRLGGRSYTETVQDGEERGRPYYRLFRNRPVQRDQGEDTDIWAIKHNLVSITPLHASLTDVERMPEIQDLFGGWSGRGEDGAG
jgi:5'-nucleotidase